MPNIGFYVPQALNERIQRLREKGVDLAPSAICQRALTAAVDAEERALSGDRLAKLLARVQSTLTLRDRVEADCRGAGRRWAEDIAALSEMREIRGILQSLERQELEVDQVNVGRHGVWLETVRWVNDGEDVEPATSLSLPHSVPTDFFEHASDPEEGVAYTSVRVYGFLQGVVDILELVEHALEQQEKSGGEDA